MKPLSFVQIWMEPVNVLKSYWWEIGNQADRMWLLCVHTWNTVYVYVRTRSKIALKIHWLSQVANTVVCWEKGWMCVGDTVAGFWPYRRTSVIHVKLTGNAQDSPCLVSIAQQNSLSELTDMRSPVCGTSALWHRAKGGGRMPWGLLSCSYLSDPPSTQWVERLQMVDLTSAFPLVWEESCPWNMNLPPRGICKEPASTHRQHGRGFFLCAILSHTRSISHVPAWQVPLWFLPKGCQYHQMHRPFLSCSLHLNLTTSQKAAATLCWPDLFGHSRCRDPSLH